MRLNKNHQDKVEYVVENNIVEKKFKKFNNVFWFEPALFPNFN